MVWFIVSVYPEVLRLFKLEEVQRMEMKEKKSFLVSVVLLTLFWVWYNSPLLTWLAAALLVNNHQLQAQIHSHYGLRCKHWVYACTDAPVTCTGIINIAVTQNLS